MLQETNIKEEDFSFFKKKFRRWECLLSGAQGASGGMAILWRSNTLEITNFFLDSNWKWIRVNVK